MLYLARGMAFSAWRGWDQGSVFSDSALYTESLRTIERGEDCVGAGRRLHGHVLCVLP